MTDDYVREHTISKPRPMRLHTSAPVCANVLPSPSRLACELEKTAGVRVIKAPREITGFRYEMTWHARLTADPAHAWFRDQLRAVARELP